MPLQKQVMPLILSQGVDTKGDPKTVQGKLLQLINARFTSDRRLIKRNGFTSKTRDVIGSGTDISSGRRLISFKDELLEVDNTSLYSYSEAATGWVSKGTTPSVRITKREVAKGYNDQYRASTAVHSSGLQCFTWYDNSTGAFSYSVVDLNTGLAVVPPTSIISSATAPGRASVQCVGAYFVLLYDDNGTFSYKYIDVTTPTTLSSATVISTPNVSNWDSTVVNGQLYIAYEDGANVKGCYYTTANIVSGSATTTVTVEAVAAGALNVFGEATTNRIIFAYYKTSATVSLRFRVYSSSLVAVTSAAAIASHIYAPTVITGISITSSSFTLFYYGSGAGTDKIYVLISVTVTNDGVSTYTPGTPAKLKQGCLITAKAFSDNTTIFVVVEQAPDAFTSTTGWGTFFVIDSTGAVVARALDGTGIRLAELNCQSEVYSLNGTYYFAVSIIDLLTTNSGYINTEKGVSSLALTLYDSATAYSHGELADALHIGGGFLNFYDGQRITEHGFHHGPQLLVAPAPVAGYTYSYVACYEWTDGNGYIHRSEPSSPLSHQQANPIDSGHAPSISVPYLSFTSKTSTSNPVRLVLYRTTASGTVYYRTSVTNVANSTSLDYYSWSDTTSDASLVGNPQLYTTGGVLENQAAPPFAAMATYNGRIFGINSLDPTQIWYSKQVVSGSPIEWSDFLTMTIPDGVAGTALASLDARLVIFSATKIFVVAGLGPDSTGANSDFSIPAEIATDVGCSLPNSIARIPQGLIFKSDKGFYLLDRSLQVSYIGADVEEFNGNTVTSAVLAPDTTEVRFTTDDERLVYDYRANQWGWDSNATAVHACVHGGVYHHLTSDGKAKAETVGTYTDDGTAIAMTARTGWIQLAGVQGLQRLYKFLLLGEYVSPHTLRVSVSYDFVDDDEYTDVVVSSDPAPYQYRFHVARQKCESLRITIADTPSSPLGEALSISALAFEVGVKSGAYKLPASKSSTPNT